MKRRILAIAVLALVAGGVYWWLQNDPHQREVRRIQKRLQDLASDASFPENAPALSKFAYPSTLTGYFTDPAQLDITFGDRAISRSYTRSQLEEDAAALRLAVRALNIQFLDIAVDLDEDFESALAHLTAKIYFANDPEYAVQEFRLTMAKPGGDWLVKRVETVKTIEQ